MKNFNRKVFLNKISTGVMGAFIFSFFPSKFLGSVKERFLSINVKVKIHPDSVKRNN